MERIYIESKAQKSGKPIQDVIKKLGIVYPNNSLGFIHARYASFSEPNGNSVLLLDSVKQDVPKLKFTQANQNHKRQYGPVLGSILAAWVNDETNEIEIVFSFYKTLYPKLWEQAQEDLENGKLTVSFELMFDKQNLVVEKGIKKLKRVDFDGVGVLFSGIKPAFKNAHCLSFAMEEIEKLFNQPDKELVFANIQDVAAKWTKIGQLIEEAIQSKQNGGGLEMDEKAKAALLAAFKVDVTKELGEEAVKGWTDEQWEAELAKRANPEPAKEVKATEEPVAKAEEKKEEAKVEEPKAEAKVEETPVAKAEEKKEELDAKKSTRVETTNVVYKTTNDDEAKTQEVKEVVTTSITQDGKETKSETVTRETTYTFAQVEEIKASYEKQLKEKADLLEAKEKELAFVKENAQKIIKIRAEMGDFVKALKDEELFDETKMKIAKLEKENAELKQGKVVTAAEETPVEKKVEELKATTDPEKVPENKEETTDQRIGMLLKQRYNKKG